MFSSSDKFVLMMCGRSRSRSIYLLESDRQMRRLLKFVQDCDIPVTFPPLAYLVIIKSGGKNCCKEKVQKLEEEQQTARQSRKKREQYEILHVHADCVVA